MEFAADAVDDGHVAPAAASSSLYSSAPDSSHWPKNMLPLPGAGQRVRAGQQLVVHAFSELGGLRPRYTFELWLGEVDTRGGGGQRRLGVLQTDGESTLAYWWS